MSDYLCWPLNEDPLLLYRTMGYPLMGGLLIEAADPREAALSARGSMPVGIDRWVTLGPEGITRLDFRPVDGCETLSVEPGAHR